MDKQKNLKNDTFKYHLKENCTFNGVGTLPCDLISDKISVSDRNVHFDDFYFFQVNESTLYDFESLSFANKINDQRLSLVYQFYKQGLIDNPSFGFLSTNFGNGNLILGKFNNTIISQNRYSASCPVVKEKNTWGCELNKIIIGDKEYRNYDYSYFVVDERKIFAPRKFFTFLKEKIMKPFVINQHVNFLN